MQTSQRSAHIPQDSPNKAPRLWHGRFRRRIQALDKSEIGHLLANGLQWGLWAYLGYEVFRAVRDVLQEIQDEHGNIGGGGGGASGITGTTVADGQRLVTPAGMVKLRDYVVNRRDLKMSCPSQREVPALAVQLADQLLECGVPLTGNDCVWSILPRLTKAQAQLLQTCLVPPNPRITLDSVGGLYHCRSALRQWINQQHQQQPLSDSQVSSSSSSTASSPFAAFVHSNDQHSSPLSSNNRQGILLYGPPGCGKSLIIQALSNELKRPALVVTPSTLQRKWYGDSTLQVRTLFGLVQALGPCLLVLDELDGLFRERGLDQEHEASRDVKTEFLQWWNGVVRTAGTFSTSATTSTSLQDSLQQAFSNSNNSQGGGVILVGATNRPFDVDSAVLRRLPWTFFIGLPRKNDRRELLETWITQNHLPISPEIKEELAQATEGYSPSDLHQALLLAIRLGPLARLDESMKREDVWLALEQVSPTRLTPKYVSQLHSFINQGRATSPDGLSWQAQQQQTTTGIPGGGENIYKWSTEIGDFYHLGQVRGDTSTLGDALMDYSRLWQELDESSGSDHDEDDEDDEFTEEEEEDEEDWE
jgi:SpoVK/Ycf46/Vps4 family AAA+-type ATPase